MIDDAGVQRYGKPRFRRTLISIRHHRHFPGGIQDAPEQDFANGVIYALARLIELHDQPVMAADILKESGIPVQMVLECDRDDAKLLLSTLASE